MIGSLTVDRKPGEFIRVLVPPSSEPQIVVVAVANTTPSRTKLRVQAPRHIEILRGELVTETAPPPVAEAV